VVAVSAVMRSLKRNTGGMISEGTKTYVTMYYQ